MNKEQLRLIKENQKVLSISMGDGYMMENLLSVEEIAKRLDGIVDYYSEDDDSTESQYIGSAAESQSIDNNKIYYELFRFFDPEYMAGFPEVETFKLVNWKAYIDIQIHRLIGVILGRTERNIRRDKVKVIIHDCFNLRNLEDIKAKIEDVVAPWVDGVSDDMWVEKRLCLSSVNIVMARIRTKDTLTIEVRKDCSGV